MKSRSVLFLIFLLTVLVFVGFFESSKISGQQKKEDGYISGPPKGLGVCPPFPLRDKNGEIINPVKEINDKVPYSPKQTCGAKGCHNYQKITEGFHFTQGKGEEPPQLFKDRYNWVTSPGNYGGNWCSPAPLYRQLAPKNNSNPRMIDMTSFEFVTATCGNCHPGGGPLEYDREGKRYDNWMNDSASNFTAGGENNLDGDYYKARWNETGVIEADCLLCHQPEYDLKERNKELAKLNFQWAASVGSGFATTEGSVKEGKTPQIFYKKELFDDYGNVKIHIVPEPRNSTCLGCHFKPDWKKRGAGYTERTDVHFVAGLKCVDCHPAGSKAVDARVRGEEIHQFGKGDDPSGWVRNDLDNTVRSCEMCHLQGYRNAPIATHNYLPPLHLEKLSCQACHIPIRSIKSALVQASDVYNPAPRISPPPKHIWTFYDQEMNFWNHYGELELFGAEDKPTNVSRTTLIKYKGKIYPANVVHSTFVGYEESGKNGLNQLFMKDFYKMWIEHLSAPDTKYVELKKIKDDNNDGVLEINREEEIDTILSAVKKYLETTNFPLEGKNLVYVFDNKVYYSSKEFKEFPKEDFEATPFASVYKFSHDVAPARAALGAKGCTDCHNGNSQFFNGPVLKTPFSVKEAKPEWVPNYEFLGISKFWVKIGEFRETFLKPVIYYGLGMMIIAGLFLLFAFLAVKNGIFSARKAKLLAFIFIVISYFGLFILSFSPEMIEYMTISRFLLDSAHFWITTFLMTFALLILLFKGKDIPTTIEKIVKFTILVLLVIATASGSMMILKVKWLYSLTKLSYTTFDFSIALITIGIILFLLILIKFASFRDNSDNKNKEVLQ